MSDSRLLRTQAAGLGVTLGSDQASRLLRFEELLEHRAIPLGAVAASDAPRIRERHTLDCLRAAAVAEGAGSAADLGSGAGLPGVVVAIALPGLEMHLVERRPRRAGFLEWVVEELDLPNARVVAGPVERMSTRVDLALARAFAPLGQAWSQALAILRPEGRLVYFAGAGLPPPQAPPGAVVTEVRRTPVLESAGALVIMARQ